MSHITSHTPGVPTANTAWHKANVENLIAYQLLLMDKLRKLQEFDLTTQFGLDAVYEQLVLCVSLASEDTIPKARFKHYLIGQTNLSMRITTLLTNA